MTDNEGSFSISLTGDVTQEKWLGNFKCKLRLSHRDSLAKDVYRRQLLGANPDQASGRAASLAFIASELSVRITSAPAWFMASDNGLELSDDNVLAAIYDECTKKEKEPIKRHAGNIHIESVRIARGIPPRL